MPEPQQDLFAFAWPGGGPRFTTRPQLTGTFGMVAATHWLASAAGMAVLEDGGNAFDAAAAAGFVLQVVQPHLNGLGGEVPILFARAGAGRAEVICGQGVAPAAATIDAFAALDLNLVPGTGLLPAVVPGAFDAWLLLLRDHGTLPLRRILAPALAYARDGYPILVDSTAIIGAVEHLFRAHWPSSQAVWLPGGRVPEPDALFCNPALANTFERLLAEAEGGCGREGQIEAARAAFYRGFVAEAIDRFYRRPILDETGERRAGFLAADDLGAWQATYEVPVTYDYRGLTVCKCGPWSQGPVFLQTLALLSGFDLAALDPLGPDFVHLWAEAAKLAFADREAYYGDPDFNDVPLDHLLSEAYNAERRRLIGDSASLELRPGTVVGRTPRLGTPGEAQGAAPGLGDPTAATHATLHRGDTCHLDVVDRNGNMVSATPSGGWLQSSPVVEGLGFAVSTRGQMFWLEPGLPGSLAPRKRPRTTLTPGLALRDGVPVLAFGTPGGDRQDQWAMAMFLRHIEHGMNLQEAIDAPVFHTDHYPSSFYPRAAKLGHVTVEGRFPAATIAELRRRGHSVEVDHDWALSQVCAVARDGQVLKAGATPRLMQVYAVGR